MTTPRTKADIINHPAVADFDDTRGDYWIYLADGWACDESACLNIIHESTVKACCAALASAYRVEPAPAPEVVAEPVAEPVAAPAPEVVAEPAPVAKKGAHRVTVNGTALTRNSKTRTYSHAVVVWDADKGEWGVWGWSSRYDLAQRTREQALRCYDVVLIVPNGDTVTTDAHL